MGDVHECENVKWKKRRTFSKKRDTRNLKKKKLLKISLREAYKELGRQHYKEK